MLPKRELSELVAAILEVVRGVRTAPNVSLTAAPAAEFADDGGVTIAPGSGEKTVIALASRDLLSDHRMSDLATAVASSDLLAGRLLFGAAADPAQLAWQVSLGLVEPFVDRYLELRPDAMFHEETFELVWAHLEEYLTRAHVELEIVAPLSHASYQARDPIAISDSVEVRPLSAQDKTEIWARLHGETQGFAGMAPSLHDMTQWECALVVRRRWSPGDAPVTNLEEVGVNAALTALRLLRKGDVGTTVAWIQPGDAAAHFASTRAGVGNFMLTPQAWFSGDSLILSASDGDEIRALHGLWTNAHPDETLAFAMRRFETAYERRTPEDRLIDHWIALEALFGQADTNAEVTYRIALRLALFLESTPEARRSLRAEVKYSYSRRSEVLHGNARISSEKLGRARATAEDVVRRALRRWLDPAVDHDMEAIELGA